MLLSPRQQERKREALALLSALLDLVLSNDERDYFSTLCGEWPPGCRTRRAARDKIRAVDSHEVFGAGRSTVLRCGRGAYEARWSRTRVGVARAGVDADELAARAIAHADVRVTRRP